MATRRTFAAPRRRGWLAPLGKLSTAHRTATATGRSTCSGTILDTQVYTAEVGVQLTSGRKVRAAGTPPCTAGSLHRSLASLCESARRQAARLRRIAGASALRPETSAFRLHATLAMRREVYVLVDALCARRGTARP